MTSSILSYRGGTLTGQDIQVLKDFALSAPYEWRKVFEALIAVAEATQGIELEELAGLELRLTNLTEEVEIQKEKVESLEANNDKLESQVIDYKDAGEKMLGEVRKLAVEAVGPMSSRWQAQLMSVLRDFEEGVK